MAATTETQQQIKEIATVVAEQQSPAVAEDFTEESVAPLPTPKTITTPVPIVGKAFDLKRASVSSVDSDISLSYDAAPFYPRSLQQNGGGMSSANNSSGSGTDDGGVQRSGTAKMAISNTDSSDSAYEGGQGKSSDESTPFVQPDEETTKRILDQVEFYFSDANIVKDAFLLKHVRRNKEGYVSLKLISSFKRVKHLAKDWRAVAFAISKSEKLELNESGTKLRRKEQLPAFDQTTPSRTVVAINLSEEKPVTIETVAELFRSCGEIALIRVLRPGNPIPSDVRHFVNKHPEMGSNVSALIEFVRTESAHNAMSKDWSSEKAKDGQSMSVLELNAPASKKKATAAAKKSPMNRLFDSEYSSSCQSGSESEDMRQQKMRMQRKVSPTTLMRSDSSWNQRRWSRDSGTDSSASGYSRRDMQYIPPQHQGQPGDYGGNRRMSSGWDSSSDSYYSGRSRSGSGVSIPETFGMRRFSLANRSEPQQQQCCCCGGHNNQPPQLQPQQQQQQQSMSMRRHSTQENHHHYDMRRCSSSSSNSDMMVGRKDSTSSDYCCGGGGPQQRDGFHNWSRKSSSSSMGEGGMGRRMSMDSDSSGGRSRRPSLGLVTPDNVVRMPKGPDGCGSRGFQREPLVDSTLYE
ncbi:Winged helix-turn-helix DNA-binding domain,La-type HTH domain,Lupus La protein,RNA recognition motif [Cinara cedri]|uniref:Winged helix-turn-helix DNA-binding domain,La-type HTH domain,Lupus La protein,RNA recognition motif n=1 Tax=Cinara cedri TaxID=506608 RepID=A0A5E4MBG8_9HEMI|nr:Winged helix-turn-helix DNA-binding domain,La-type HTH domain,Lupus La protein,RNA recognition motif [Cinara cedri]